MPMDRPVGGLLGSPWIMAEFWWRMTSATLFGASTVPPPRPGDLPAVFLTANTLSFFKLSHVSSTSWATALVAPTTYTSYVLVAAQPRVSDSSLTLDTADICSAEASAAVQSVISASTVAAPTVVQKPI